MKNIFWPFPCFQNTCENPYSDNLSKKFDYCRVGGICNLPSRISNSPYPIFVRPTMPSQENAEVITTTSYQQQKSKTTPSSANAQDRGQSRRRRETTISLNLRERQIWNRREDKFLVSFGPQENGTNNLDDNHATTTRSLQNCTIIGKAYHFLWRRKYRGNESKNKNSFMKAAFSEHLATKKSNERIKLVAKVRF